MTNNSDNIDWGQPGCKISKYFTVREVTQGKADRQPEPGSNEELAILVLAQELDKIREAWGGPIGVTSWYRPPQVNGAVGGARDSQHIYGKAADIRPVNGKIQEFQDWLDKQWAGALGYAAQRGFVHVDMRNGQGFSPAQIYQRGVRWNYV